MPDVTSGATFTNVVPNLGATQLLIETANTVDDTDTVVVAMDEYGATTALAVLGFTHSTEDSVIITEAPTTSVSGTDLTITVGGSTDNKKRVFLVWMK